MTVFPRFMQILLKLSPWPLRVVLLTAYLPVFLVTRLP